MRKWAAVERYNVLANKIDRKWADGIPITTTVSGLTVSFGVASSKASYPNPWLNGLTTGSQKLAAKWRAIASSVA
jgi:hypothetical protein